jgi:malate synthase
MADRVGAGGLLVERVLWDFITDEVLPGTGIDGPRFWAGLGAAVQELTPRNRALLSRRDDLQAFFF